MDARPFHPRGVENRIPVLHQRHKSTGNIAAQAAASQTGFRGTAKRAAFGDVTNLPKNNGLANGKALKPQASTIGLVSTTNKENTSSFVRPAQRLGKDSSVPAPFLDANRPVPLGVQRLTDVENRPRTDDGTYISHAPSHTQPQPTQTAQPKSQVSQQPRHHKSQPQLKQPQPILRRTQSRMDTSARITERPSAPVPELPASVLPSVDESAYLAAVNGMYIPDLAESAAGVEEQYAQLASTLPGITEEVGMLPIGYKDATATVMSEPEEYWDHEDLEEYDDQDQAYTTAHSFRSQNMTSGVTTILAPRITTKVQRELEEAKLVVEETRKEDEEEEIWDVSMVAEYGDEIFGYMRELENKMLPNPHYMDNQTEIQWSMRSVLMDWLVQVHSRFSLLPETLFLTVNYIDRFLTNKIVSMGKLQLVGATAILVASKYEEINCPSLSEIVYMVDSGYTTDEILKAERFMLSMLGFELGWPGPMSFLRRVSKADDYDLETRTLAKYFLELTIMDERFVASPPSFLAAGAHCLSRLILKKGDWTKAHVHFSGYTWSQLKSLVTLMIGCCEQPTLHHQAVFEKYREKKFKEASLIVQDALDIGFTLPHCTQPVRRRRPAHIQDSDFAFQSLVSIEG